MYIFISATFFAILSILMGAFAHHTLQSFLTSKELHSITLASRYLFYNSIPLLVLFFTNHKWKWPKYLPVGFIVSTILFSGSIYTLVFFKLKQIALLTPMGGIGLMLTWLLWARFIKRNG